MIDISGKRFGLLVAKEPTGQDSKGNWLWECECDCGSIYKAKFTTLNKGKRKSCGCNKAAILSTLATTHGMSKTPTYSTWMSMKRRCLDSRSPNFANYGGRGILICDGWRDFENFFSEMGVRPKGTTLDRIDNEGNYTAENCRWADTTTQHRNTRTNVNLTYKGRTQCLAAWADEYGIRRNTLQKRIANGWSVHSALNTL